MLLSVKLKTIMLVSIMTSLVATAGVPNLYDIPLKDIQGHDTSLKAYKGKVLLIINVASKCGHTPQYAGLEEMYKEHKDQGLVVLGFPCNDFGAQEPGSNQEIQQFCKLNYGVTFPMFDKLHVKGEGQHPLYAALTGPDSPFPGDVKWNFGKFLVGRDGKIIGRFEPGTKPDDGKLVKEIESALAARQ
jgi:glutathione peroxidase